MRKSILILFSFFLISSLSAQQKRARDLGIPFRGTPGTYNAITDVKGIEVGHSTIIKGKGALKIGEGPARTGVIAVFPRGKKFSPVYANWYSLNGNGEMTGTTWLTESGFLETPIMITNTNSVGVVRDAVLKWYVDTNWYGDEKFWYTYPVVAETYDGELNDIYGFHVKEENVREAIEDAKPGPVKEGNVGGGTGMRTLGFKSGIGSSSRMVHVGENRYTLGVLVQSNFGTASHLTLAGVPIGLDLMHLPHNEFYGDPNTEGEGRDGSIIVIVATDAPLLPHQLKRIAQRIPLGINRTGGYGTNGSGDIFIAFSTANEGAFNREENVQVETVSNDIITPLFIATTHAVEEAIINSMVAAETLDGIHGNVIFELPEQEVEKVMKKYNRWLSPEVRDPRNWIQYTGIYGEAEEVEITLEENRFKFSMKDGDNSRHSYATPIAEDTFEVDYFPILLKFKRESGKVISIELNANGVEELRKN
ncbi:L-aminopeptidase/D-esterase-like protein [Algoriphagus boseongensis]|uniref:L-aminopeptidase/D-esterase-like protein n=1 Tax=Algoriphagus boseongensis TaxID=1442587 RepID=A0A4R6T1J0_9BACT|nr:P1 family peptidase [Algoriphagus boseongensis]TDQ15070.1 L-aminopeptidase/D-esterase-like protein [Algoriphagus boseongensis]